MTIKKNPSDVDKWIKARKPHQVKALEKASKVFDNNDVFTVNTLEAIYGKESSYGKNLRSKGIPGAAGHFHIEEKTALRFGLIVSKANDQRFDIDNASDVASRYIKELDDIFRMGSPLGIGKKAIAIEDKNERKLFVIAAYNGGEGRIAKAQQKSKEAGGNSKLWEDVKNYLVAAEASEKKAIEIIQYVEKVIEFEEEFSVKSLANKLLKNKKPSKLPKNEDVDGHWITKDGDHIFIKNK